MKSHMKFRFLVVWVLFSLLIGGIPVGAMVETAPLSPDASTARTEPLIIDHEDTDLTAIPQEWIEAAKNNLHIAYGHTSHGSQLSSGMSALKDFANEGGLDLALPLDIFQFSNSGNHEGEYLHFFEGDGYGDGDMDHDAGYYPDWVDETYAYLGTPDPVTGRGTVHTDTNVIIWSWCGQVSGRSEQEMIDTYLAPMTQLELDYPGVVFVYMTGHADGSGEEGNLHLRNQQIRDYAIANNKVLYDFYDIELYDPDGNYYGDKHVNDNCDYDSDGDGSRDANWATQWQNSHTEGEDWYSVSCAHSQSLNCNRKAYAAWALWASLADWTGPTAGSTMEASAQTATRGDTLTYTLVVQETGAPLTATVALTAEVPAGLTYVPGSLTATSGITGVIDAPARSSAMAVSALTWTGVLTPTPAATVTYQVSVTTAMPQVITSTAVIVAEGAEPINRSVSVEIMRPADVPDLTPSSKTVSPSSADFGDVVTYTVSVANATGPLSTTVVMTDMLRPGLSYVSGSLTTTAGLVNDVASPTLTWIGVLSPTPYITITYAAVVTYPIPGSTIIIPTTIVNTAIIAAPDAVVTRTATLQAHLLHVYLPVVLR